MNEPIPQRHTLESRLADAALVALGFFVSGLLYLLPGISVLAAVALWRGWKIGVPLVLGWSLFGFQLFVSMIGMQAHDWIADLEPGAAVGFGLSTAVLIGIPTALGVAWRGRFAKRALTEAALALLSLSIPGALLPLLWIGVHRPETFGDFSDFIAVGLAFAVGGIFFAFAVPRASESRSTPALPFWRVARLPFAVGVFTAVGVALAMAASHSARDGVLVTLAWLRIPAAQVELASVRFAAAHADTNATNARPLLPILRRAADTGNPNACRDYANAYLLVNGDTIDARTHLLPYVEKGVDARPMTTEELLTRWQKSPQRLRPNPAP